MWIKTGLQKDGGDHRHALPLVARRRRLRLIRVASTFYTGALQTVTYKIPPTSSRAPRLHQQAALRAQARARHAAAALRHGVPDRQGGRAAGLDPADMRRRNLAEPFTKTANHLTVTHHRPRRVHRPRGRGLRLAAEARRRPPPGRGIGIACSSYLTGAGTAIYWNDMPHSGVVVRADRSGLASPYSAAPPTSGRARTRSWPTWWRRCSASRPRISVCTGGHRPDAGGSGLLLVAGDAHGGQCRHPGGGAAAGEIFDAVATKLEVEPERLPRGTRRVFVTDDEDRGVTFAEAVVLAESRLGVLAFPGSYAPPKRAGQVQRRRRRALAVLFLLGVRGRGGRGRGHRRGQADRDLDRPRRRPRAQPAAGRGPGGGLDLHGARRGAHGGAGLPEGRAQDPLDARVQEPDHARDAGDPHHPRGDRRSRGPVRRQGSAGRGRSCR